MPFSEFGGPVVVFAESCSWRLLSTSTEGGRMLAGAAPEEGNRKRKVSRETLVFRPKQEKSVQEFFIQTMSLRHLIS